MKAVQTLFDSWRMAPLASILTGLTALLSACVEPAGFPAAPGDVLEANGEVVIAPQQYIDFSGCPEPPTQSEEICPTVNLEMIACSAAIDCRDGFLRDPDTNENRFTLTTSLACGFDESPDPGPQAPVFDSIPGYVSRVTCLDANGNAVPSPVPQFGEHRFFAQVTNTTGDFFLNTARIVPHLFSGSPTPASCTMESWAALSFQRVQDNPPEARTAHIKLWAPVIEWHATLLPAGPTFDCPDSWVQKHVFFSTIHDRADANIKRTYPAHAASLLSRSKQFTDPLDGRIYNALESIGWQPVRFPNAPNVPPISFEKHAFFVHYPADPAVPSELVGRPASLSPRHACIETDAAGFISHVGFAMNFEGYETSLPPVVVIVDRSGGFGSWDCRRESGAPDAPCIAFGALWDTSWPNVVPCLVPQVPDTLPPVCGVLDPGQVASSQELCSGEVPSPFVVTAPSGGIGAWTYQWQENVNGSGWNVIESANLESYQPLSVVGSVAYQRVAMNACGTVISNPVTVLIAEEMVAGAIGPEQTLCPGDSPQLLAGDVAIGGLGGWTYQWQENVNGSGWTDIASANLDSYQPFPVVGSVAYQRVAMNACGTVISNPVTVTVHTSLYANEIGPSLQEVCPSQQPQTLYDVSMAGGSGDYIYSWESSPDGTTWLTIPGETGPTYLAPDASSTTYFRRIVQDAICNDALPSDSTLVLVPRGGHIEPGNQLIQNGDFPVPFMSVDDGDYALFNPPGEFEWERQLIPDPPNPWELIPRAFQPDLMPYEIDNSRSALYRRRLRFAFCGEDFYSNIVQVDVTP